MSGRSHCFCVNVMVVFLSSGLVDRVVTAGRVWPSTSWRTTTSVSCVILSSTIPHRSMKCPWTVSRNTIKHTHTHLQNIWYFSRWLTLTNSCFSVADLIWVLKTFKFCFHLDLLFSISCDSIFIYSFYVVWALRCLKYVAFWAAVSCASLAFVNKETLSPSLI